MKPERHLPAPGPGPWSWRCLTCGTEITNRTYHKSMIEIVNWWDVALALIVVAMLVYGCSR